jgi:hypothetical protein
MTAYMVASFGDMELAFIYDTFFPLLLRFEKFEVALDEVDGEDMSCEYINMCYGHRLIPYTSEQARLKIT